MCELFYIESSQRGEGEAIGVEALVPPIQPHADRDVK